MFEDDDLCLHLRQAGYRIVTAEDSFVHHFGSGSFSQLPCDEAVRIFEENRRRFEQKWSITWQPHRLRSGVRPPAEEPRFRVSEFLNGNLAAAPEPPATHSPQLKRLLPATTKAGIPINPQPDGSAALAVECDHATPGTLIRLGQAFLETSYGSPNLLSAVVPPDLLHRPGVLDVTLVNDVGWSESLPFVIEG
jgi:hypothetical protein